MMGQLKKFNEIKQLLLHAKLKYCNLQYLSFACSNNCFISLNFFSCKKNLKSWEAN